MTYRFKDNDIEVVVNYKRIKRINIRVIDDKIVISSPIGVDESYLKKVLDKNVVFIERHYKKKNDKVHFFGRSYEVVEIVDKKDYVLITDQNIIIYHKETKKPINVLYNFYYQELKKYIDEIKAEAFSSYQLEKEPTIVYRVCRSQFGSYAKYKNRLLLSIHLAKYDKYYIKSVLYHELAHVYEQNHSAKFYEVYEAHFPNCLVAQKELKRIRYADKY